MIARVYTRDGGIAVAVAAQVVRRHPMAFGQLGHGP